MTLAHSLRATGVLAATALMGSLAAAGPPQPTGAGTTAAGDKTPETKVGTKESYRIDKVHSMALFRVRHLNAGAFWGRFNDVSGSIEFDPASDHDLKLDVVIDASSVDTGSENLDKHVMAEDFFWAEQHPKATFVSTSARRTGTRTYEVTGDLTMRGVTRTITTPIEWLGTASGPMGRRGGFETTFTVRRSDYGINYGVDTGLLGDETRLVIALEGIVDAGGGAGGGPAGRGRGPGRMLERLDTDGDGKLQRDELPERIRDRFDAMDTNGDGAIDEDELSAMRGARGGRPGAGGAGGGRPGSAGADGGSGGRGRGGAGGRGSD